MTTFYCAAKDGWEGIADALSQVQEGDEVRLAAGTYRGFRKLSISGGVSLIGDEGVKLIYTGTGTSTAIELMDVLNVTISGLDIRFEPNSSAEAEDHAAYTAGLESGELSPAQTIAPDFDSKAPLAVEKKEPSDSYGSEDPLTDQLQKEQTTLLQESASVMIRISNSKHIRIEGCGFDGARDTGIGIETYQTDIEVIACKLHRFSSCGIVSTHSSVRVTRSEAAECQEMGIALQSSTGELLENECWGNGLSGISLARSAETLDSPSVGTLTDNHCRDNGEAGIVLFSSTAEVGRNVCRGNTKSGIVLQRDCGSLESPSEGTLNNNRCHDNQEAGIQLVSSTAAVNENECWGNAMSGILLQRQTDSLECPSEGSLINNRCHDNQEAGIQLLSSTAAVNENECWENVWSGILLQRQPSSMECPSAGTLMNNRCHDNHQTGIVLFCSTADVTGNECWNNAWSGIALERASESLGCPSASTLVNNRCHDNHHSGIVLLSSTADVTGNECRGNAKGGIMLERASDALGCPSAGTLTGNRCHDNHEAGIQLLSSSASVCENKCWGNAWSGILLQRQPSSMEFPSAGTIINNHCHDNQETGIVLVSSTADVTGNECWGNAKGGIRLERDANSAECPSAGTLINNRCHDNHQSGILLLSSTADVTGNECWGNAKSGITLERDADSAEHPSAGTLTANRCHDNHHSGVLLLSSTAEMTDNECWGNDNSGIVLLRSTDSLEYPSVGTLFNNRCHDNLQAGVLLLSSTAELTGNECWSNVHSGILLLRADGSPKYSSTGTLTGNRCHDNHHAGIMLVSSTAEMTGNECWGNAYGGIALTRISSSLEYPSVGTLTNNRCYNNLDAGIRFSSSDGKATGNELWDNHIDDIVAQPLSELPTTQCEVTKQDNKTYCSISSYDLRTIQLEASPAGRLISELESDDVKAADDLANFLFQGGCEQCFERFWASDRQEGYWKEYAEEQATSDNLARHYQVTLTSSSSLDIRRSVNTRELTPLQTAAELLRRSSIEHTGQSINLGIVSSSDAQLEELCSWIQRIESIRLWQAAPDKSELDATLSAALQQKQRAAEPLIVDTLGRSGVNTEIDQVPQPLLEAEILQGRKRWHEQLIELLRGPAPWLALLGAGVAAGIILLYAYFHAPSGTSPTFADLIKLAVASIAGQSIQVQLTGLITMALIAPLFFRGFANLFLPQSLQIGPSMLQKAARWCLRLIGKSDWIEAFEELLAGSWVTRLRTQAWRRWVRRRVFGGRNYPAVVTIYFRNVDVWANDDIDRLKDLVSMRRPAQSLLLVTQMRGLSTVASGLLGACYTREKDGSLTPQTQFDEVRLMIDPAQSAPALFPPESVSDEDDALGRTLGWTGSDTNELDELKGALGNDAWSVHDVLPMLVIGSTPFAQLTVEKLLSGDFEQYGEPLRKSLVRYSEIFQGSGQGISGLDRGAVKQVFDCAQKAEGILETTRGRRVGNQFVQLIGRHGFRQPLAAALRNLHNGEETGEIYLRRLTACGELFNLREMLSQLEREINAESQIETLYSSICLHLEAAHFLLKERLRAGFQTTETQQPGKNILDQAWVDLETALSGDPPAFAELSSDDKPHLIRLCSVFLSAMEAIEESGQSPFSRSLAELLAEVTEFQTDGASTSQRAHGQGAMGIFLADATSIVANNNLDPSYSEELLDQRLSQEWYCLPEKARAAFRDCISDRNRGPQGHLTDILARASDADAVMRIARSHLGNPALLVATLAGLAARQLLATQDAHSELPYVELGRVGIAVEQLRRSNPVKDDDLSKLKITTPTQESQFGPVLEFLLDEQRVATLCDQLSEHGVRTRIEVDGIALGTFSTVNRRIKNLEPVILRSES